MLSCSSPLDDPTTPIQYTTPIQAHIKITVENSYNTVIAILVNEEHPAGYHSVQFDASNLAEGVYFYTLEATNVEENYYFKSKKTLLLIK